MTDEHPSSPQRFEIQRLWKPALLTLTVFLVVGGAVVWLVERHGARHATPRAEVQLAAMMGGLFAGGAAAAITMLMLAFGRKR